MRYHHQTIGLLGGSFNPAHDGHVHLSREAKKRLGLDGIWWIISPQNPLKPKSELAPYADRLAHAQTLIKPHPFIRLSEIETEHHLRYSIDTIRALQNQHPRTRFVWLIGADNLAIFHRWRNWQQMMESIPIAVFDRAPYSHSALRSKAAIRYRAYRLDESDARALPSARKPAWVWCSMPRHATSATDLRKTLGNNAFFMR